MAIELRKTDDGDTRPIIICDVCNEAIASTADGVFTWMVDQDGNPTGLSFVHKTVWQPCYSSLEDEFRQAVSEPYATLPWDGLASFVYGLRNSVGMGPGDTEQQSYK